MHSHHGVSAIRRWRLEIVDVHSILGIVVTEIGDDHSILEIAVIEIGDVHSILEIAIMAPTLEIVNHAK